MVEDSEDDAELIRLELESADFVIDWRRVETEQGFLEALEEPWDLIISDYQMPGFDGLRAFALYKERELDTPFIFVSGALGEERAVSAMRAGARDYLVKGNLARLSVAVRRELDEARARIERREAEQMTRREQRRLAMAVEASGAGIFEYTLPVEPDAYCSERWAEILGYTLDDLPTHETLLEWELAQVHPDDLPMMQKAYEGFIEGSTDQYAAEVRMRHKQGAWVEVATFAKAVERDSDQRATHVVGVMLDLSERRTLEEQLRQAQKMEAVGRLAGGVAHDFNNLLTVIFSFGQFVLDALGEDTPAYVDMQEVLKAARNAETLTAQLLAFSRRRPVSPMAIHVNGLVEDMDRMLRRIVSEDVEVALELAPDLCNVRIDPGSLEQVVVNLAVNARDAMPEGGKLTIATANAEVREPPGSPHVGTIPPGEYAVLSVSDTGMGMDQETTRRIFEPFFTTKEAGKGTGLGLSTCYGIVKQAGGHICVRSELGHGATFEIYLPRIADRAEQVVELPEPTSLQGTETILVVEDDEQVRRLAVRALTRLGYCVVAAANGSDGLRQSQALDEPIHLLLTDVVMPAMSGKKLVGALLPLRPDIKVLYMSGYSANAIVHRGVLEPGTHMIQKPFTPELLARKIREVLDG
jgi:hypothetical protein